MMNRYNPAAAGKLMYPLGLSTDYPMKSRAHRAMLFALYQLSILVGILAMPLALLTRQAGFTVPIHRLITRIETAHENAQP